MARYRRTISFPAPKPDGGTDLATASDKLAAYRIRSASLPCRFHPLVLQLDDDVAALRLVLGQSPPSAAAGPPSSSSVSAAASQVGRVLASLSDLLHHPQAREPLRRLGRSAFAERLLDDLLRLADAHGSFRQALVALAALQAETRAALRRGDPARLASAARAQRRAGRDLPRLATAVRAVAARPPAPMPEGLPADAAALAAAVADATVAVASGSAAVISGLSSLSNAAAAARVDVASTPCWITSVPSKLITAASSSSQHAPGGGTHHRIWWVADLVRWMSRAKRRSAEKQNGADSEESSAAHLRRSEARAKPEERARKAAFEQHDNLEWCIANVDRSGEKVFRALVNTRVSLLNILSPSF